MTNYSLNIIGAGRLGKTLGKLWTHHQSLSIKGVYNLHFENSQAATELFQQGTAYHTIIDLPPADLWLIATKDDQLEATAKILETHHKIKENNIIFHCCGFKNSQIFSFAHQNRAYCASIHPMKSFSNAEQAIDNLAGAYCSLEGDLPAKVILKKLFEDIGGIVFEVSSDKKMLYHVAGVMASNYLVTLYNIALKLLEEAEINNEIAKPLLLNLMTGTLNNLARTPNAKDALTGPLQRGDLHLIAEHLQSLSASSMEKLYKILGTFTLELTTLDEKTLEKLTHLLRL